MLVDNPMISDFRVEREAQALTDTGWQVHIHAVQRPDLPTHELKSFGHLERSLPRSIRSPLSMDYARSRSKFARELKNRGVQVIHAHDHACLDFAVAVKRISSSVRIVYDAHEYLAGWPLYKDIPEPFDRLKGYLVWRWSVLRERANIPFADSMITVSKSLCAEFKSNYQLKVAPLLIRNIPNTKHDITIMDMNEILGIDESLHIHVHSGNVYHSDARIAMLLRSYVRRKDIFLLFICNTFNKAKVLRVAESEGLEWTHRIGFIDYPKDHDQLMGMLASCDVGVIHTWQPDWPSHWLSLPNRLMEYTLCGLPIIATKQPEFMSFQKQMGHCVLFHGEDENELDSAIDQVEMNTQHLKMMAKQAAGSISWEQESKALLDLHHSLQPRAMDRP